MSLSLLITINVLADIALLAGLAHAMSRATRLKPHVATLSAAQSARADDAPAQQRHTRPAAYGRPQVVRPRASMSSHAGAQAAAAHE
jgi:hypothetical protein